MDRINKSSDDSIKLGLMSTSYGQHTLAIGDQMIISKQKGVKDNKNNFWSKFCLNEKENES